MRKTRIALVLVLVLLGLLAGLFRLSKATTFQFFGRIVATAPVSQKLVALTFDDGPTASGTDALLEILDQQDVKATFFLVGSALAKLPEAGRRLAQAGHQLGNHTYSHHRMLLKSHAFIRQEIESTDALIRATGFAGEILFRPPYGKKLFGLPWYLRSTGRTTVTWDVETDSRPALDTPQAIAGHVVANVKPGSIILLHAMIDPKKLKRRAVPLIIEGLRARGFRFVTVSELLHQSR